MREVGLGLGSNLGDRISYLRAAVAGLHTSGAMTVTDVSRPYETPPWGYEDQNHFVNACVVGQTQLEPLELMRKLKELEASVGRTPTFRWGPRVIDIDIIYIDGLEIDLPDLIVPHKDALSRAFVLLPLEEIRPDLIINGIPISTALSDLDRDGILPLAVSLTDPSNSG